MSDRALLVEPSLGSTENPMGGLGDLLSQINPEFFEKNQGLILKAMELLMSNQQEDPSLIRLDEYGLASREELHELAEVVPRYNDLVEEFESLDQEYQSLEAHFEASAHQLRQLEQKNQRLLSTLSKAKQAITSLKSANQQLKLNNQNLQLQIQNLQGPLRQGNSPFQSPPANQNIV